MIVKIVLGESLKSLIGELKLSYKTILSGCLWAEKVDEKRANTK